MTAPRPTRPPLPTLPIPADARWRMTRYASERDTRPIGASALTLHELLGRLRADGDRYTTKLGGPCVSPGILCEGDGVTRCTDNVVRVEMIGLDIDEVDQATWDALIVQLDTSDVAGITYSTHSHGAPHKKAGTVCARVLMPLSRALVDAEARDLPRLLDALAALLGDGIIDRFARDPARLFFTPRVIAPMRAGWLRQLAGTRAIDTDALLAQAPTARPQRAPSAKSCAPHAGGPLPSRADDALHLAQGTPEQRADVAWARNALASPRADASERPTWMDGAHALARELGPLGWPVWRDWSLRAHNADDAHRLWEEWGKLRLGARAGAASWSTITRITGIARPSKDAPPELPPGAQVLRPQSGDALSIDHARTQLARGIAVAMGAPIASPGDPDDARQLAQAAGPIVIVAPPGTGKTRAMGDELARRVWADPSLRVLVVTRSHALRAEMAATLREAITRHAPDGASEHNTPRVRLDAARDKTTCNGTPKTWDTLQQASRARSGGAAALCASCIYNTLGVNYRPSATPCTWARSRDTDEAQIAIITHARYALWARAIASYGARALPLMWSWSDVREAALSGYPMRPVLRATLETWRVSVERVPPGERSWTPPDELQWAVQEVRDDDDDTVMREVHTPTVDTVQRVRASIAAWWHLDDDAAHDDAQIISAAMAHDAYRGPYDMIIIDEDPQAVCISALTLSAGDVERASKLGILTGDTGPLQSALKGGARVDSAQLAQLLEGVSAPSDVTDGVWDAALTAWAQGDTIGAQGRLADAVPDTLGALWSESADTVRMYVSPGRDGGEGALHLRAPLPIPHTLPRTYDGERRPLARRIVCLDATASPQVTRAIWGPDAMHYEVTLPRPANVHITHVVGDSSSRVWASTPGHDASAAQRAVRAVHAAYDAQDTTLHIATKRALEQLGPLIGPALHHDGTDARGSNAHEACTRVIIDAWHVPRAEITARGEMLRMMHAAHRASADGDGDDAVQVDDAAGWREVARHVCEDVPVIQALHRVRPHASEHTSIIWHNVMPPERVLGALWSADVTLPSSVLVWDATGHAWGPDVTQEIVRRALDASPETIMLGIDDADALRDPERWGAARADDVERAPTSTWRMHRRDQAQAIADAVGARVVSVRSSAGGGARIALTRAAHITSAAVHALLDAQEVWSWCDVEGVRAQRVDDAADRCAGLTQIYVADVLSDALDAGEPRDELARLLAQRCGLRQREAREILRTLGGIDALRAVLDGMRTRALMSMAPRAAYARASGVSREVLDWYERELERELCGEPPMIGPAPTAHAPRAPVLYDDDARDDGRTVYVEVYLPRGWDDAAS